MSGFRQAQMVEAEAMVRLRPWLREYAENGQYVVTSKGTLAPFIQEIIGDMAFNRRGDERLYSVELKAERKWTGNLFLETWSNKNLECRSSHAERGSNYGWLFKLRADLLFYYFLDTDRLYIFDFFRLKQWAFGRSGAAGRIYDFPEKGQGRYQQLNDTHGRIVPLDVLHREVGWKLVYPQQLALFPGEAA